MSLGFAVLAVVTEDAEIRAHFNDLDQVAPLGDPAGQKVVYSCRLPDGTLCALKLVRLPLPETEETDAELNELVARMRREIEILASIESPYVTRLAEPETGLRLCTIAGRPYAYYFEMLIDGESVASLLANGLVLPPLAVAQIGLNMAFAIAEFWSRGTVHRDVKPANVMRDTKANTYVLLDAGYALDLAGPSLTRVAGIPGTLPYLAPERLDLGRKRQLDFRSDLYSLGVVMYEGLSGHHPYITSGMSQDGQLQAIAGCPSLRPTMVAEGSEHLWAVVLRLLEKHPHARYRSCQSLADELGQFMREAT